jgi:hypothetical protein
LLVDVKTKVASGAWSRAAWSRLSVPFALTVKSVCGSEAAQSCEGCAAVCTMSSMSRAWRGDQVDEVVYVQQVADLLALAPRSRCT